MILLAKAGKRVVRLKGGDPMIFGRAGEEIAACRAAGIAVEVVPGITPRKARRRGLRGLRMWGRRPSKSRSRVTPGNREVGTAVRATLQFRSDARDAPVRVAHNNKKDDHLKRTSLPCARHDHPDQAMTPSERESRSLHHNACLDGPPPSGPVRRSLSFPPILWSFPSGEPACPDCSSSPPCCRCSRASRTRRPSRRRTSTTANSPRARSPRS